jgi:hypothetical protein
MFTRPGGVGYPRRRDAGYLSCFIRPVGCASYGDDTKAIVHNP